MKLIKNMKNGICMLPGVCMFIFALLAITHMPQIVEKQEEVRYSPEPTLRQEQPEENVTEKKVAKTKKLSAKSKKKEWKDGVYTGSARGYGGNIDVRVTIAHGKIKAVEVLSHKGETSQFYEKAKGVVAGILKNQTTDVDVVSGATYSSRGIINAVVQALQKAGGAQKPLEIKAETASKKKKVKVVQTKKTTTASGEPKDGVYEGTATCEKFGYQVSLKAKFKDGKVMAVYHMQMKGNNNPQNEVYMKNAWRGMVKRILSAQNKDVDMVSGATYSSQAIWQAYRNAYEKAVGAGGQKKKHATPKPKRTQKPKVTAAPKVVLTETPVPTQPMATDTSVVQVSDTLVPQESEAPVSLLKDGRYKETVYVYPNEQKEFHLYKLTADVIFENHVFSRFENVVLGDTSNKSYVDRALNGTKSQLGVTAQLVQNQKAVDAVSGATCSFQALVKLYEKAYQEAGA